MLQSGDLWSWSHLLQRAGEERGVLGAVGFPQPRPCRGLWPQSQACAPDPAGTLPHSCDSVGRPPGGLTWVALVAACLAVGTVVTAGVEALNAVHLALLALPRALGHGLLARAPGLRLRTAGCSCPSPGGGPAPSGRAGAHLVSLRVPPHLGVGVRSHRTHSFRS